jgi:hypothetical protein
MRPRRSPSVVSVPRGHVAGLLSARRHPPALHQPWNAYHPHVDITADRGLTRKVIICFIALIARTG